MARLLPLRSEPDAPDSGPRVLDLDADETDEVFSALSSDTARDIYRTIHDEPAPPSDIADRIDSSIQNVRYHLENLEEAGLVEVADTWYSSRGNEMSVYAPSSEALVLAADENEASRLRTALSRLLGGVAVLAMASLAVQATVTELLGSPLSGGDSAPAGADGGDAGGADGAGASNVSDDGADVSAKDADGGGGFNDQTTADTEATGEPRATTDGGVEIQEETTVQETTDTQAESMSREATTVDNDTAYEATTTAADAAASGGGDVAASGVPPGVLFFAGGLAVLVAVVGYWYVAGR